MDLIVSEEGYGANPRIQTTKPLVVVTGPGPGSGKMATCLSQVYHEHRAGGKAMYAKFETLPIWNLPLKHPLNIAYEAATLDLKDFNLIALSIGAALTPMVQSCLDQLHRLRGCQMHLSHVPVPGDEAGLRKLGIELTSDPVFASKRLFVE